MGDRHLENGDLYIDENETLWRVIGFFTEPAVILEQVEAKENHQTIGVSGLTWQKLKLIYRRPT